MNGNIYESDRVLSEYVLFHYGTADEVLPFPNGPRDALAYPVRTVRELVDTTRDTSRALDLGCAVGRSTFELANICDSVVGIDFSSAFICAAQRLASGESVTYQRHEEGEIFTELTATAPRVAGTVTFITGDAMALPSELGEFDVVHMANLIDRLARPLDCLRQLPRLVRPGGQLILTTPCTWLEEFTPRSEWLGAVCDGEPIGTLQALVKHLEPHFQLELQCDMPFLLREHARKYQWSMALATRWIRY